MRKVRKATSLMQASCWSVSLADQTPITLVQGIFSTVVLFSVEVYAWRMELSVLPHFHELLFAYAGAALHLLCSLPRLAEWVLCEHLHLWNECSASHPGLRSQELQQPCI